MANEEDDALKYSTSRTSFPANSKELAIDQKKSVIQSVLASVPRELPLDWNASQSQKSIRKRALQSRRKHDHHPTTSLAPAHQHAKISDVSGNSTVADDKSVSTQLFQDSALVEKQFVPKEPPLSDPFAKSIAYYEKHQVLNHFQHMTARLVLHRPENALEYMIEWCKQMQIKTNKEKLAAKALYEDGNIDVYDELIEENSEENPSNIIATKPSDTVALSDQTPDENTLASGDSSADIDHHQVSKTISEVRVVLPTIEQSDVSRGSSASQPDYVSLIKSDNEKITPQPPTADEDSDSDSLELSSASSC